MIFDYSNIDRPFLFLFFCCFCVYALCKVEISIVLLWSESYALVFLPPNVSLLNASRSMTTTEEFIVYSNSRNGLGVRILGAKRATGKSGVFIKQILDDGLAQKEGRLKVILRISLQNKFVRFLPKKKGWRSDSLDQRRVHCRRKSRTSREHSPFGSVDKSSSTSRQTLFSFVVLGWISETFVRRQINRRWWRKSSSTANQSNDRWNSSEKILEKTDATRTTQYFVRCAPSLAQFQF